MLVTVSGPPGSGKSTVASGLSDDLGYTHVSGGDIFRDLAAERGLSLAEFNALAEEDDRIDRDLDRRLRDRAKTATETVLESRLSGWMAGDHADIRVWLDAPMAVRAARIAEREGKAVDQARLETERRERSEATRYREYYDIDIADRSIYDLVVNTGRWTPTVTVSFLARAVRGYEDTGDEGGYPVTGIRYEF